MKKYVFLLVACFCTALAFSQQTDDPVYVNIWFLGDFACEYAENGIRNEDMKSLQPFIQKDQKLYFVCFGLPLKSGNLRSGFELVLAEGRNIMGIYNGTQRDYVNSTDPVIIVGFAEPRKITVTQVFSDEESFEKWAETIKIAE
jgi:hypothetical protein